jgi:hypothetical protein
LPNETCTEVMLMRANLRLYHTMIGQICKWLPEERITRVRNLALLLTGLYLSRKVHRSLIAEEWHLPGKTPSLVNLLRRFRDNPRVSVGEYYQPVAESLLSAFRGLPIRLIMDTTKHRFDARLVVVSIAYRKRALLPAWSVHRGRTGWVKVQEQIALLRQVAELIPKGSEVWLLGDCEFQHAPLLSWLELDQAARRRLLIRHLAPAVVGPMALLRQERLARWSSRPRHGDHRLLQASAFHHLHPPFDRLYYRRDYLGCPRRR